MNDINGNLTSNPSNSNRYLTPVGSVTQSQSPSPSPGHVPLHSEDFGPQIDDFEFLIDQN